ncbi:RNA polymerase sigma factor SigV [Siminovitchia terrae]|uniref:RNA polymerase sigma factor n=1 Tax=Siminovitchia terrae TaxID=1914933 RepID=A0A429X1R0_SIMTE|nr:sigma-70 family RNA polymerase sigma factor [Siminovitchia terrae]RST57411.1 sigma-70 family RNA polymerase sigma factor [Siminovitchia terrae]GIN89449.1 RNA polymerase sigma factor SigV [Siminovitchia terrae]GIN98139.1 RNA polymerase sigma factor SigV [Siminovitchia terrae]
MIKKDVNELFVTCINDHKEDFYRLAFSYVKNKEDALDIVQESIKKALISIEAIKNPSSIKSWFYKIVVYTALDFLRKQKKITLADDQTIEYLRQGKEDAYKDIDLYNALDELPLHYKTVITLRYFEDLKLEEIAEIVDENINTVKTRLYRGLKLLRITITEEELT